MPKETLSIDTKILSVLVETLVFRALTSSDSFPNLSKQEQYDMTEKNFEKTKDQIAFEVQDGFSRAVARFSGQDMDYSCVITPFPDAVNKEAI